MVRFDAAAFSQEAQDEIAGSVRYWNEAAVSGALDQWCRTHLAPASEVALAPEAAAAPISDTARVIYSRFIRSSSDPEAASALNLLRGIDAAAFQWVTEHDDLAASLVVRRGWHLPRSASDLRSEWDDEATVARCCEDLVDLYRDLAGRPNDARAGLGTFQNWGVLVWQVTLHALQAALSTHAKDRLPMLIDALRRVRQAEQQPTTRPPLFS